MPQSIFYMTGSKKNQIKLFVCVVHSLKQSGLAQSFALQEIKITYVIAPLPPPGIQDCRDVKLQLLIEKNKVVSKYLFMLETVFSAKVKWVDKDGEEILAHCENYGKDSVVLSYLCKLLFLSSR